MTEQAQPNFLWKDSSGADVPQAGLSQALGGPLTATNPVITPDGLSLSSEVYDDFTTAPLGNFISRVADSGQTYVVAGDTTPKIETVNGVKMLSIANATTSGIHSFYLQAPLTANCRYVFAKVMYGSTGSTTTSSVSIASPTTSVASLPDAGYDIGVHGVASANGGVEASTWVDMTPIYTSDLDGTTLSGSTTAPTANVAHWIGWILCEDNSVLTLTPYGTILTTRDTRYAINSGPFAWIEPYLTAGDTDVRPYVLEWASGCSIGEAAAAFGTNEDLSPLIFKAMKRQALGRDTRGNNAADVGTAANTTETDLHTYTLSGGTCGANNDQINAKFAGTTAANGNTKRIRVRFNSTTIFDSTAVAFNAVHWAVDVTIIRVSSTTFRTIVTGIFGVDVCLATYTAVTAAAANDLALTLTGTNGTAAANDIVAKLSTWEKAHAA